MNINQAIILGIAVFLIVATLSSNDITAIIGRFITDIENIIGFITKQA